MRPLVEHIDVDSKGTSIEVVTRYNPAKSVAEGFDTPQQARRTLLNRILTGYVVSGPTLFYSVNTCASRTFQLAGEMVSGNFNNLGNGIESIVGGLAIGYIGWQALNRTKIAIMQHAVVSTYTPNTESLHKNFTIDASVNL